jgi:hypothetical protein
LFFWCLHLLLDRHLIVFLHHYKHQKISQIYVQNDILINCWLHQHWNKKKIMKKQKFNKQIYNITIYNKSFILYTKIYLISIFVEIGRWGRGRVFVSSTLLSVGCLFCFVMCFVCVCLMLFVFVYHIGTCNGSVARTGCIFKVDLDWKMNWTKIQSRSVTTRTCWIEICLLNLFFNLCEFNFVFASLFVVSCSMWRLFLDFLIILDLIQISCYDSMYRKFGPDGELVIYAILPVKLSKMRKNSKFNDEEQSTVTN